MIPEDPLKYWEETGKNEDGLRTLELEPELEVIDPEELTLDKVTTLCHLIGVDPDKVLFSDEQVELPDHPTLNNVHEFFNILVVNRHEYDIEEMPASQVKILIAALTTYFIKACSGKLDEQANT